MGWKEIHRYHSGTTDWFKASQSREKQIFRLVCTAYFGLLTRDALSTLQVYYSMKGTKWVDVSGSVCSLFREWGTEKAIRVNPWAGLWITSGIKQMRIETSKATYSLAPAGCGPGNGLPVLQSHDKLLRESGTQLFQSFKLTGCVFLFFFTLNWIKHNQ